MRVVETVMAGDKPREHSRIGRMHVAADHGEPHAGKRLHAEALEHAHMAVTAAEQHEVLEDGRF